MAFNDDFSRFFTDLQDETPTEETEYEWVVVQQDPQSGFLGGKGRYEKTDPAGRIISLKEKRLIRTCIGCVVTTDPRETRYPHYSGKCSWGHDTCSLHLHKCDEPGCDKLVCPRDGVEYRPGKYKCFHHYYIWKLKQVFKFFLSPFIEFPD